MADNLAEVRWSCPTCLKKGKVGFAELGVNAYRIMAEVKKSHRAASADCIVSYPNFGAPQAPSADEPELPKAFSVIMYPDEVYLITMCMYYAQCMASGVEPYPTALPGVKHWMDVVGVDRIHTLTGKFHKIANIEDMNTVLHIVYKEA